MLYERLLRPALFSLDAESAHERVTSLLAALQAVPGGAAAARALWGGYPSNLGTRVFGLDFSNPIGLAAGFDKDARLTGILPALGFGFVEVGSVTLSPQPGNPKPRLFRLPEHQALINRLGFNSEGSENVARRLSRAKRRAPIGVNLGLNKDAPKDQAAEKYAETFRRLEPLGDYFAVNVSSPNTTGLRDLQEKRHLETILAAIQKENPAKKPVLVKISPDLNDDQLDGVLDVAHRLAAGVIATNTTTARPDIPADTPDTQGGLSGSPLRSLSTQLIRKIRSRSGRLPIVGVGGVFTGGDALEKILAGASLVQLYTGLIYRGPGAAAAIARELRSLLTAQGFGSVAEAVGAEASA